MINAYSATQSSGLSAITRSFLVGDSVQNSTTLKAKAFWFFRIFLALKIALPFAFPDGEYGHIGYLSVAALSMVIAIAFKPFRLFGLAGIFALALFECWRSWPFTINHAVLELAILLLMMLVPDDSEQKSVASSDLILILMLSVWFYSGIQKIIQGYYLNGEFFALEVLAREPGLGEHIHKFFSLLDSWFHLGSLGFLECCKEGVFELRSWQVFFLLGFSWVTIIVELALPLFVLFSPYKNYAIAGLFIFQFIIAYFSGEIDFAFTAFAILLLFIPKIAPLSYTALGILLLWGQPWL